MGQAPHRIGRHAYMICTAPRSGSTLLCHLLRAAGVAGWPGSHFHVPDVDRWRQHYDLPKTAPLGDILAAGHALGCGSTDLFGLRLQPRSRDFFCARMRDHVPDATSDRAAIEATFGPTKFIFLKRDDVLAQAVSLVRAEQSGLWHKASDGTEIERVAPPQEPVYHRPTLSKQIATFEQATDDWRAWFKAEGITPLELRYAALADDPIAVLRHVLEHLGRPPNAADQVAIPTARLADAVNADWIARYNRGE